MKRGKPADEEAWKMVDKIRKVERKAGFWEMEEINLYTSKEGYIYLKRGLIK